MSRAVFISYASEDSGAAQRICDALRNAGIEVWFDRNELRGGDAWEAQIRRQIKECTLFMPLISAQSQSRPEGFFRLEWHLAEQRTFLLAGDQPFLVPVVIDGTTDAAARVPDRFREKQWTRLTDGNCPPAFCTRLKALLRAIDEQSPARETFSAAAPAPRQKRKLLVPAAAILTAVVGAGLVWHARPAAEPAAAAPVPPTAAQQLVAKADAIMDRPGEKNGEMLAAADELYGRALALDPSDATAWAKAARLDAQAVFLHFDVSDARRDRAKQRLARAMALAPGTSAVRRAQAAVFAFADGSPPMLQEAERIYRELYRHNADDKSLVAEFGLALRQMHKFDEAARIIEQAGLIEDAGWTYCRAGKFKEANRIADKLLATHRTLGALYLKITVESMGYEDLDAVQAAVNQFTPEELLADAPMANAVGCAFWRHDPERALALLQAFPKEFIFSVVYSGPKRYLTGLAYERAGQPEAARAEWSTALSQVESRLKDTPNDREMLGMKALLLACLGERAGAESALALYRSLAGLGRTSPPDEKESLTLLRLGRKEEVLRKVCAVLAGKFPGYELLHFNLRFNPSYETLRGDPRLEQLLRDSLPPDARPFPSQPAKPARNN